METNTKTEHHYVISGQFTSNMDEDTFWETLMEFFGKHDIDFGGSITETDEGGLPL
jgi:predicted DNA-binding ribbon-helix-helix protein